MNNRQVAQITYAALYKHEDYFQSRPIYSYPSTSNLMYYNTKVLLSRNRQMYPTTHYTHLVAKTSTTLSQFYICFFGHFMFTCCRGKSYIGIGDMSSWTLSNLCRLLCVSVVVVAAVTVSCCCLSVWINNYSWTRTTITLHSNNNMNPNKKIAQFIYIDVFLAVVVVVVVTRYFFLVHM